MLIDAEDYVILVHTDSHPAERHIVDRDVAVGLVAARRACNQLSKRYPRHIVTIYHRSNSGAMIFEVTMKG